MAVERAEQPGQGGVALELIAGTPQKKGSPVDFAEPLDVLQRACAGAGNVRWLAANGEDEPEALDRRQPTQKRLGRGRVLAPGRLHIVEDHERRRGGAGGGDCRLHFRSGARGGEAEIGGQPAQQAFGVRRGLEIDEDSPVLAEARDHSFVIGRCKRQRRLAHAESAGHDDGPILIEDRLDEFIQPILAPDHFWVGRQGRSDDRLGGRWSRRGRWRGRRRALARGDLPRNLHNLVDGFRHVPIAIAEGIVEERFPVARPSVLVAHDVEGNVRCRRQQERIEMDVLAIRLPLADNGDFLVDYVVG